MNKKIADYLPYYTGSDAVVVRSVYWAVHEHGVTVDSIHKISPILLTRVLCGVQVKPLLRPLSSMTREEMSELHMLFFEPSSREIYAQRVKEIVFYKEEPRRHTKHGTGIGYTSLDENKDHIVSGTMSFSRFNADQFHYLLKQGFDLFGLIEAGLAVDKTKEVPHGND